MLQSQRIGMQTPLDVETQFMDEKRVLGKFNENYPKYPKNANVNLVLHDIGEVDDLSRLDGLEDRVSDGDGAETIFGVREDVVGTILKNAHEDVFLDERIAAAVAADSRFDPDALE